MAPASPVPVTVAPVTPSLTAPSAPGSSSGTSEFPSRRRPQRQPDLAWQDGTGGVNHIRLVTSADRGATWSAPKVLTTGLAEFQPALTAESKGLHLAFYQKNPGNTVDVVLSDSTNATSWKSGKVTSVSFPGVLTTPPFDPIIAPGYMGDYIANVTDGKRTYLAWGDNRDVVKNFLWPTGRHDPDVFFAKRSTSRKAPGRRPRPGAFSSRWSSEPQECPASAGAAPPIAHRHRLEGAGSATTLRGDDIYSLTAHDNYSLSTTDFAACQRESC